MADGPATATATVPSEVSSRVPLRAWVFTINNPTPEDEAAVLALGSQSEKIKRLAVGREVAPTTGTPHLQGYVRFVKSCRRKQVCLALGGRAYVAPRIGSESAASSYALKGGHPVLNVGQDHDPERDVQEERSRSAAKRVIEMIDSGSTPREIWEHNRIFFMYNAKRIREEVARHKWYSDNPTETGFAPVDKWV